MSALAALIPVIKYAPLEGASTVKWSKIPTVSLGTIEDA
jgi:hypothetical protein